MPSVYVYNMSKCFYVVIDGVVPRGAAVLASPAAVPPAPAAVVFEREHWSSLD